MLGELSVFISFRKQFEKVPLANGIAGIPVLLRLGVCHFKRFLKTQQEETNVISKTPTCIHRYTPAEGVTSQVTAPALPTSSSADG